jgi:hypothetical protein
LIHSSQDSSARAFRTFSIKMVPISKESAMIDEDDHLVIGGCAAAS